MLHITAAISFSASSMYSSGLQTYKCISKSASAILKFEFGCRQCFSFLGSNITGETLDADSTAVPRGCYILQSRLHFTDDNLLDES